MCPAENGPAPKKKGRTLKAYWDDRQETIYLLAARTICRAYCPQPGSVLDVGSHGTPTLDWHRTPTTRLVSVDLRAPYRGPGVEAIRADFLTYEADGKFDLVTCFQVLEHVPDPVAFAEKLLAVGHVVVVSVPYRWPKGASEGHVHDPVDEAKMRAWFGRAPTHSYLAKEPVKSIRRLIHVYAADGARPIETTQSARRRRPLLHRLKSHLRKLLD